MIRTDVAPRTEGLRRCTNPEGKAEKQIFESRRHELDCVTCGMTL
jgi:hypothetical protein